MAQLLFSAAHKSSGKTTVTLGICTALARQGITVQPFKKGPDYIDPMWLTHAAGRPCYNLDFHTMSHQELLDLFAQRSAGSEISLIEGNMGLFDSLDVKGSMSNAALAKLLDTPVVLVLDVKGATRSIVPVILGFQQFDPALRLGGIILNKVAGSRHEQRLREVIAYYCDIPVLGAVHRDPRLSIDERHLGLIPSNEAAAVDAKLNQIADLVAQQVDLAALRALAASASLSSSDSPPLAPVRAPDLRIAYACDAAFGFYYPDDLEALQQAGAQLIPFDTLQDQALPKDIDGLLIGGGFPETQMAALEANRPLHTAIRAAIEDDLPCYAECGGLMYLSRSLRWGERHHQMVGIIPGDSVMHDKPVGRGYARISETAAMPWPQISTQINTGVELHVHEFHYSSLENLPTDLTFAYKMGRGVGINRRYDGFVYRNLLANYVHLRSVGDNRWTERFVQFVRACRDARRAAQPPHPSI
ncbi:MAG: cobyrinate a,c-diamide synthase [Gammaproteobacteria bacterium]|nr:cobyrinate a,c-diamide synthase [Gammaproteobacteria bacterium]